MAEPGQLDRRLQDAFGNPIEPWCLQDVQDAVTKIQNEVPGVRCRLVDDGRGLECSVGIPAGRKGSKGNPFRWITVFRDGVTPGVDIREDIDAVIDLLTTGAIERISAYRAITAPPEAPNY
jgi:hypothetical protein